MAKYPFAILTPYFGGLDWEHHVKVIRPAERKGITLINVAGCPYIDMARAYLADVALSQPDDHFDALVFIDQDMILDVDDILPMVDRLLAQTEFSAVGAGYITKRPGGLLTCSTPAGLESLIFYQPGYQEVDFMGFGLTAIKREVFLKMRETLPLVWCGPAGSKVYPYFHHRIDDGNYSGEDVSFFRRLRECGFKAALDTDLRVWHKGNYKYAIEDSGYVTPRHDRLTVKLNYKPPV